MPKYVMLSTLGPDGSARLRDDPQRLKAVNSELEAMGVTVLDQYALLGPYDFLNIIEAPDEITMMRVATSLGARGTLKTLTLTAMDVDTYIDAMGDGVGG
ncbi:MAG: GYD domain-containing protein [Iamia sp.]